MTQRPADVPGNFSATEGVYPGGGLAFIFKHPRLGFSVDLMVDDVDFKSGRIRWSRDRRLFGVSGPDQPLSFTRRGCSVTIQTQAVRNRNGWKVNCAVSANIPEQLRWTFYVKPIASRPFGKKKRRR